MFGRRTKAAAFAMAILTGAGACNSAVSDDDRADRLTQKDWIAETINGKAVINPGRVTLAFVQGRVSGRSGCNLYSGPVEIGNGTLKIGILISTKMACAEGGVMAQESIYLETLRAAQRYGWASDGKLTVSGSSGGVVFSGAPRQQRPEG
jgi:heat shock protein HslJ